MTWTYYRIHIGWGLQDHRQPSLLGYHRSIAHLRHHPYSPATKGKADKKLTEMGVVPKCSSLLGAKLVHKWVSRCNGTLSDTLCAIHKTGMMLKNSMPVLENPLKLFLYSWKENAALTRDVPTIMSSLLNWFTTFISSSSPWNLIFSGCSE